MNFLSALADEMLAMHTSFFNVLWRKQVLDGEFGVETMEFESSEGWHG